MSGTTFISQVWLTNRATGAWNAVAVEDFNRDGHSDIAFRNSSTGQNLFWYMNGIQLSQQVFIPAASDLNWQITGAGDVNGDDNPDLLWHDPATRENAFWYMSGNTVL